MNHAYDEIPAGLADVLAHAAGGTEDPYSGGTLAGGLQSWMLAPGFRIVQTTDIVPRRKLRPGLKPPGYANEVR